MDRFSYDFTRTEYEYLCKEAMLRPIDQKILECKIQQMTYIQIGNTVGMCPDTVNKRLAKIRNKIIKIKSKNAKIFE